MREHTLAEYFKDIAKRPVVKAALPDETRTVRINEEQLRGLEAVAAYMKENGFSSKQASLSKTYLLAVTAAYELYERHKTSQDVIELERRGGTACPKTQFWLVA